MKEYKYYERGTKKHWIQCRRGWYTRFNPFIHISDKENYDLFNKKAVRRAIADYHSYELNDDRFPELSWPKDLK